MNAKRWRDVAMGACLAAGFTSLFSVVPPALASSQEPIPLWLPVSIFLYTFALLTTQVWSRAIEDYGERLLDTGHALLGAGILFAATMLVIAVYGMAALIIVLLLSSSSTTRAVRAMADLCNSASMKQAGAAVARRQPVVGMGE